VKKTLMLSALILVGVILTAFAVLPSRENSTIIAAETTDAPTKKLLHFLSENGTSGALLIIRPGNSLTERYWTWKNQSVDSQTLFNLGSLSKQFTGFIIFQLEAEKKISTNQVVSNFLEETKGTDIGSLKIIDLLSMTSGLPHDESLLTKFFSQISNRQWDSEEIVREVLRYPLRFPSGTAFQYSNLNYVLLGQIISRLERKPLAVVLNERILKPFGMQESFLDVDGKGAKTLSKGHLFVLGKWLPMPNWNYSFLQGAGGVVSTVKDLQKWLLGLQKYLSHIEAVGKETRFHYAYGWSFREGFLSHDGESPGFCSYIVTTPDAERAAIITLNSDFCLEATLRDQMISLSNASMKSDQ
jgi:CubicO group peptidase (beta-lactamase class C family)